MFTKIAVVLSLVAIATAGVVQLGYGGESYGHESSGYAPVAYEGHGDQHVDYHAHPKYDYSYSVSDPHTGDHKTQHEARDGDVVKGEYSLLQPDGSFRKVTYTADDHSGFNAIVHNTAPAHPEYHH
ncbi:cuticle protein 7-like [Battus philenor]|uniref:cuticle protein 7-like n=1 Tax=Battus philenor TaxID=42288 RepID=UPI0035CE999B